MGTVIHFPRSFAKRPASGLALVLGAVAISAGLFIEGVAILLFDADGLTSMGLASLPIWGFVVWLQVTVREIEIPETKPLA